MTCSARLPVYSIIIGLIISEGSFLGIKYKALVLMGMYLLGFLVALFSASILKRFIKDKGKTYLVMDLPAYKNRFSDMTLKWFWVKYGILLQEQGK